MTWNFNPSQCPRNKESDGTPWQTGSTLATDCTPPPHFINKGEPQLTVNNPRALLGEFSLATAQRMYQVLIDGV